MLLGIITSGVFILVVSLVIYQHQESATAKLLQEFAEKNQKVETIRQEVQNRQNEELRLQQLKEHLSVLDKNLADYKYVPTYLREMQNTAAVTNNKIRSIQPGELRPLELSTSIFATAAGATPAATTPQPKDTAAPKVPQYQVQSINLDMQGTYASIIDLLNRFRKFPKMIYVRSLDLTPQLNGTTAVVSARIQTYAIITPDQYLVQDTARGAREGGK
jgi:Tfp pilus assembly protein PilO